MFMLTYELFCVRTIKPISNLPRMIMDLTRKRLVDSDPRLVQVDLQPYLEGRIAGCTAELTDIVRAEVAAQFFHSAGDGVCDSPTGNARLDMLIVCVCHCERIHQPKVLNHIPVGKAG